MTKDIDNVLEDFTPLNTVPHMYLELDTECYEDYLPYTLVKTQVKTCLTTNWLPQTQYLDTGLHADDSKVFDWSDTSMIETMTTFKIGNGNKGLTPNSGITALASIIYTGTIGSYELTVDKVIFYMSVPKATPLAGASELGLYNTGTGDLMSVSFYPDLNKPDDMELQIVATVNRRQQ